ncbi:alpha/beta hydrolase [Poseidonocella sedimentorum]|uniref:Palmitoyl-protein thioesterase ABHD10, mitochondrial n=1 Tax=Poseidonocella sedimentorum TaxID=871652 RepID=A0A1I6CVJ2_9RHOB|nr:alpha/beta hydrolase [Poseidonocella sedimentorum]SFQ97234.1 Alpha/beta hydrolase family protein [Poseidonocella sedimentorum]
MAAPSTLSTAQGREIAYHWTEGAGAPVVFLGGYKSDMTGTKATHLEAWARARGRAFLRFDYSGHGQSSGRFEDGTIGQWAQDAQAVIIAVCAGRAPLLIGSSMGGWIALLCIRNLPEVAGFVGIAAAPDFTEDGFWAGFDDAQKAQLEAEGQVLLPSGYGDPYVVTKALIEDGRQNLVLRSPMALPFPVRLFQGTEDTAVAWEVPLRLMSHASCDDMRLTFVKNVDHSFSTPACLDLVTRAVEEIAPL